MITLGSLFDGIGGWQLAAVRNGVKPLWSSDAKRYKAIGNGMAQPCADFVIEKLAEVLRKEQ